MDQLEMLESRVQRLTRCALERPVASLRSCIHALGTRGEALPDSSVEIRFDGQRLRGSPQKSVLVAGLYRKGIWELLVTERFKECVKPGMTVLDVGADVGYYSLLAAKRVGRTGRVVAFEPVSAAAETLRHNVSLNGYRNVVVSETALFSTSRQMLLSDEGNSTLTTGLREGAGGESTQIRCERLDDIASELRINRVDLIKMDIEGGEIDALLGGEELLRRDKPILVIEVHPKKFPHFGRTAGDLADLLSRHSYDVTPLDVAGEPLQKAVDGRRRRNFHVLCVQRDSEA